MITEPPLPLEDELGDVLEKAMRRTGMSVDALAARSGVPLGKIRDAIDYRPDLTGDELKSLARNLGLNEVGLQALGAGQYPKPEIGALPFCVWPLHMRHGIGVVNAYLVGECGGSRAVLFDTGAGITALGSVWPASIRIVDAVFLTHVEPEHAGGLCDVVARYGAPVAYIPMGATAPCGSGIGEGETRKVGALSISAFTTPGHSAQHNCYLVTAPAARTGAGLLISGDLFFAGSVGGAYFSHEQLQTHLSRMLRLVPPNTVIAPGHGPLTTAANEIHYNPFVV